MKKENLALIFGGLTLVLFTSIPYLLDLIEPAKSTGQIIGENVKGIIDGLNGKEQTSTNTKRDSWLNILTIISAISFTIAILLSISSLQSSSKKWYGITGILLSVTGIGMYFSSLLIGVFGLIAILLIGALVISAFVLGNW